MAAGETLGPGPVGTEARVRGFDLRPSGRFIGHEESHADNDLSRLPRLTAHMLLCGRRQRKGQRHTVSLQALCMGPTCRDELTGDGSR